MSVPFPVVNPTLPFSSAAQNRAARSSGCERESKSSVIVLYRSMDAHNSFTTSRYESKASYIQRIMLNFLAIGVVNRCYTYRKKDWNREKRHD